MNQDRIHTDSFVVKKHDLRVYRVFERGSATTLWTSEIQAARYVQKLYFKKLLVEKKRQKARYEK